MPSAPTRSAGEMDKRNPVSPRRSILQKQEMMSTGMYRNGAKLRS